MQKRTNIVIGARVGTLLMLVACVFAPARAYAAWSLAPAWNTGDINSRASYPIAAYDRDHSGVADHYVAPIAHGVESFDKDGNTEWSYSGITRGYDTRDIAVGDLQGDGYDDTIVVGSGYYTASTDGRIAILDKDGNQMQLITVADQSDSGTVYSVALDGTTIYAGLSDGKVEKFVKSGSAWVEDTNGWPAGPGGSYVQDVTVADLGNGPRVIFSVFAPSGNALWVYKPDGTLDWSAQPGSGGYADVLAVGNVDDTNTGDELVVGYQNGLSVYDKDGNDIGDITTGYNVRESVMLFDPDGSGHDDIYYSDMGKDIYCFERTGVDMYTQKYSLLNQAADAVLYHYDINDDGTDEVIAGTSDGHLKVFSADLSTTLADINVALGTIGGLFSNYARQQNGVIFSDINGDGHADILTAASNGYMLAYDTMGLPPAGGGSGQPAVARTMRLFAGHTVRIVGGTVHIY